MEVVQCLNFIVLLKAAACVLLECTVLYMCSTTLKLSGVDFLFLNSGILKNTIISIQYF